MSGMAQSNDPSSSQSVILVLGLTGGIASGKSTVSALLAERGAAVIDADRMGHEVIRPDGEAYAEVVAAFGEGILEPDGTIARPRLGAIVFGDPAQMQRLNAISHPRMAERMAREIAALRFVPPSGKASPDHTPPPLIVLDAAILFEAGWEVLCDQTCAVVTDPEIATERLMARNGFSREEARTRLAAQMDNEARAVRADRVLPNEGDLAALAREVDALWAHLLP